jgi:hypothetical protein
MAALIAPQAPATPKPATPIGGGSNTITLPQDIARPMTQADVQMLVNRRSELSRQITDATRRRTETVQQIGRNPVVGRAGLEARLKVLDERIVQLEKDIALNGQLIASAPPNLIQETTPAPPMPMGNRSVNMNAISIVSILFIGAPLVITFCIRMLSRDRKRPPALPPEAADRMARIETAVESIALEVERISEGQRFVTRLLNENRQLGAGPAEPIVLPQREAVRVERNEAR